MSVINVANKLEVKPNGMISIPGCEPVSSLSGDILAESLDCCGSLISLDDLKRLMSSVPPGDHKRVSAGVPSTAPPTPSEVAISILSGSPWKMSAVTSTPDFSERTDSMMTTEGRTHSGSSIKV